MREDTNEVSANEMLLIFESNPVNEGLARVTAASFCTQLNPTLEEIADLKTAVSEAVTNCIIHGYEGRRGRIEMHLSYRERELYVDITDYGVGSVMWRKQWNRCILQNRIRTDLEWDLRLWRHLWMNYQWNRNQIKELSYT